MEKASRNRASAFWNQSCKQSGVRTAVSDLQVGISRLSWLSMTRLVCRTWSEWSHSETESRAQRRALYPLWCRGWVSASTCMCGSEHRSWLQGPALLLCSPGPSLVTWVSQEPGVLLSPGLDLHLSPSSGTQRFTENDKDRPHTPVNLTQMMLKS